MKYLISGADVFLENEFKRADILISDGRIVDICDSIDKADGVTVFKFDNCVVVPGLTDVHVHLREPGFLYKETMASGTLAAARGGYTDVCAMPNLNPVPDSPETLEEELSAIRRDAKIRVHPYGAITKGQNGECLAALSEMSDNVIGFSDDGKGVPTAALMREAMKIAKEKGKLIAAHCEDVSLLGGSAIHDGEYARKIGHKGISSESEWRQVERDIELVRETGARYHVCHVSTKESVALIRKAKAEGLPITCETGPHYLTLDERDLKDEGRFKMNPPLRSKEDREALIKGICDGTVDMIATDHAPHSAEEKAKGLIGSAMGIVGIETAFPVLYTSLVKSGRISLARLIELMSITPARIFGIEHEINVGAPADIAVFDLAANYDINPEEFLSKGRSTPFEGRNVFSKCVMTMLGGEIVWKDNEVKNV